MDAFAENIANATTTRTDEGGPYRRKDVHLRASSTQLQLFQRTALTRTIGLARTSPNHFGSSRSLLSTTESRLPELDVTVAESERYKLVYDPSHPDANADGYVLMPNVNVLEEMVSMVSASRAYEANVNALSLAKQIAMKTLDLGK
jgi:flagellar basal-body rod protein FlgC